MSTSSSLRAALAFLIFVLGILQAWDSDVFEAGLLIVFLVSLAIPLAPIALLIPLKQQYMVGALVLALALLIVARLLSPIPLPGLYITLAPAAMGLIFAGLIRQERHDE
jgi:hypothetical protein